MLRGEPGQAGFLLRAEGHSDASQGAADIAALDALNGWRKHRYGSGASVNSASRPESGQAYTDAFFGNPTTEPHSAATRTDAVRRYRP